MLGDGQPCADHDRASGEGVNPQEYTLIKMGVQEVKPEWNTGSAVHCGMFRVSCPVSLGDNKVFFVAATLRPETMYGQTNCFVLPTAQYGIFQMNNGEVSDGYAGGSGDVSLLVSRRSSAAIDRR